ncbi:MAG: hypothetical protein KF803_12340 [Cyclobacteriaceae bacterium]|nr:hypothetical protein [Cyclobacteriaceae bacterium]
MEFEKATDLEFINAGLDILANKGELLICIRHAYAAGDKNFKIIRAKTDFLELLKKGREKDSVILFFEFQYIIHGLSDKNLIQELRKKWNKKSDTPWLGIWELNDFRHDWFYIDTWDELENEIADRLGHKLSIIVEPDWTSEHGTINAYIPDNDGHVRPGVY